MRENREGKEGDRRWDKRGRGVRRKRRGLRRTGGEGEWREGHEFL